MRESLVITDGWKREERDRGRSGEVAHAEVGVRAAAHGAGGDGVVEQRSHRVQIQGLAGAGEVVRVLEAEAQREAAQRRPPRLGA